MYIQDDEWLRGVFIFLKALGVKEPKVSDNEFSPKYSFRYSGADFFIYSDGEGYSVYSDPKNAVQDLTKLWNRALEESNEAENE